MQRNCIRSHGSFNLAARSLGATAERRFARDAGASAPRAARGKHDEEKSFYRSRSSSSCGKRIRGNTHAAQIPSSANAAVTTNYIFRGISQSAAIRRASRRRLRDIRTGLGSGWAASINFNDTETEVEIDLYGSYTLAINDALGITAGFVTYNSKLADGRELQLVRVYAGVSTFGVAALNGRVYYSPDYVNLSTDKSISRRRLGAVIDWLPLNANVGFHVDHAVFPIIDDYLDGT